MKNKTKKEIYDYLYITIGTCILAAAFHLFIKPNDLLVSGMGGIALLIAHFFPISLGVIYLVLNIPLFFVGWRSIGMQFLLKSIWGTVILSLLLSLFAFLPSVPNAFFGGILGGILSGVGIGMVILAGGATGGTDIVSIVINQKYTWSIGTVMFLINVAIVIAGTFLFGWQKAILTVISLYVTTLVINFILKKFAKTQKKEEHLLSP
ncbi:YitT family protein [Shimazuella kribbensis]|uniref:YitT family protein n=1 Tax=Shimazuella kribbensis TaxID=139808 RepID=UPI0004252724|nr:YitT family protein [Shimazuella kribbensis]